MNGTQSVKRSVAWLPHWWVGVLLTGVCWPLNWTLPGPRTAYLFFPLWLGYILIVDGIVTSRTGSSIWTRSRRDFALLFVASSPVWWMFEVINQRTGNWEYLGSNSFTEVEYYLLCTICFSTVMPAVFETAELVRTFRWVERFANGPRLLSTRRMQIGLLLTGLGMLTFMLVRPHYFYPLVWCSLVLIFEPINAWLRRPHLLQNLKHGDWRPVVCLGSGALICGFFWEMWNYYSWPQWQYHTPGAQFLHIFKMPLLGYGGYIPFALELYELKNFLWPGSPQLRLSEMT